MSLMISVALASASFLATPYLGGALASRSALSQRFAAPVAFAGDLSEDEMKSILRGRGVPFEDAVRDLSSEEIKRNLLARLEASTASSSPISEPNFHLSEAQRSFPSAEAQRVDTFERVSPSVAFIQTSIGQPNMMGRSMPMGAGSGFVWDDQGHIITNAHVVAGVPGMRGPRGNPPRRVMVSLQGCAEPVEALVLGVEMDKDLAVLKIDPSTCGVPLKPLDVSKSTSDVRVGQSVLAIGNPFGLDYTLTSGIVSALGRDISGAGGRPIKDCIQTDAAINPGNSGGPLLDSSGRLVGVNTMIYSPNGAGGNVGIGFAIPADTVKRVVTQIITYGPNTRPSIGVTLLDDGTRNNLGRSLRRKFEGAVITEVVPGGPADQLRLAATERRFGGVMLGDMIVAIDGKLVRQNEDLVEALEEHERDTPISLTVMRNCDPDRVEELQITPVARRALMDR